jgi:hypothetical protein
LRGLLLGIEVKDLDFCCSAVLKDKMLLRFRGPDGMQRLEVEPTATFGQLGEKVCFYSYLVMITS